MPPQTPETAAQTFQKTLIQTLKSLIKTAKLQTKKTISKSDFTQVSLSSEELSDILDSLDS